MIDASAYTFDERRHEENQKCAEKLEAKALRLRDQAKQADLTEGERDFLRMAEPIKVGHHSERRHRKLLEKARTKSIKFFELTGEAEKLEERAQELRTHEERRVQRIETDAMHLMAIDRLAIPGTEVLWLGGLAGAEEAGSVEAGEAGEGLMKVSHKYCWL